MRHEEFQVKFKELWAWAERHGYKRYTAACYHRDTTGPNGGICTERLVVDGMVVRYDWLRIQWGTRCPYSWETQREGWLHDITINPTTDKMGGIE